MMVRLVCWSPASNFQADYWMRCVLTFCVLVCTTSVRGNDEISSLLSRVVEYRSSNATMYLRGTQKNYLGDDEGPEARLTYWSLPSEGIQRVDYEFLQSGEVVLPRRVDCWQCILDKHYIQYVEGDASKNVSPVLSFFPNQPSDFKKPSVQFLGCLPKQFLELDDSQLSWLNRFHDGKIEPLSTIPAYLDGYSEQGELVSVSRTTLQPDGMVIQESLTIDSNRGPSIVLIDLSFTSAQGKAHYLYTSKLKNWGDYWFPIEFTTTMEVEGSQTRKVVFTTEELRRELDASFSLASNMNIKEGTNVIGSPKHNMGAFEWNGSEIVPVSVRPPTILLNKDNRPSTARILLAINVGAIAIVAGLLLSRYMWSK